MKTEYSAVPDLLLKEEKRNPWQQDTVALKYDTTYKERAVGEPYRETFFTENDARTTDHRTRGTVPPRPLEKQAEKKKKGTTVLPTEKPTTRKGANRGPLD